MVVAGKDVCRVQAMMMKSISYLEAQEVVRVLSEARASWVTVLHGDLTTLGGEPSHEGFTEDRTGSSTDPATWGHLKAHAIAAHAESRQRHMASAAS